MTLHTLLWKLPISEGLNKQEGSILHMSEYTFLFTLRTPHTSTLALIVNEAMLHHSCGYFVWFYKNICFHKNTLVGHRPIVNYLKAIMYLLDYTINDRRLQQVLSKHCRYMGIDLMATIM